MRPARQGVECAARLPQVFRDNQPVCRITACRERSCGVLQICPLPCVDGKLVRRRQKRLGPCRHDVEKLSYASARLGRHGYGIRRLFGIDHDVAFGRDLNKIRVDGPCTFRAKP